MHKKKKKQASWFWYNGVGGLVCGILARFHDVHIHNEATKDLKPPFIALGNHQGAWDFVYGYRALRPHRVRLVATRYQFFRFWASILMRKIGVIGKSQFAADPAALREILRTMKRGGVVLIYPSGRISLFGEDAKPFRGTYEMLQKLDVPVVMVHLDGSYRTGPRYNQDVRKCGRVDVHTSVLFTPEQLRTLPADQGRAKLDAAFCHDDFDSPNQGPYKSRNIIAGLEDLLYICPACKSDFTLSTEGKNTIKCAKCDFTATMDTRFRLTGTNGFECPSTISAWGRMIRAEELKRAEKDPSYAVAADMQLCEHVKTGTMVSPVGTVRASYDAAGFHLKGERRGEPFVRDYSCEEYPALHFLDKVYLIVPDAEDVICAQPPIAGLATQFAVVSEMFADRKAREG